MRKKNFVLLNRLCFFFEKKIVRWKKIQGKFQFQVIPIGYVVQVKLLKIKEN